MLLAEGEGFEPPSTINSDAIPGSYKRPSAIADTLQNGSSSLSLFSFSPIIEKDRSHRSHRSQTSPIATKSASGIASGIFWTMKYRSQINNRSSRPNANISLDRGDL